MPKPLVNENIRILRKKMGLTQEKFAMLVGIKRSLVGAYEEGRAIPPTENLAKLSRVFGISLDQLLNHSFYKDTSFRLDFNYAPEPVAPSSETPPDFPELNLKKEEVIEKHIRELANSIDHAHVNYVSNQNAAQYTQRYNDPVFLLTLPSFRFPGLPGDECRAFDAQDDFVFPGAVIIGRHVKNLQYLESGKNYVLITRKQGIIYRRVYNQVSWKGNFLLSADIHSIPSAEIPTGEVLEAWETVAYVSYTMPKPSVSFENLERMVTELNEEIKRLKA